MEALCVWAKEDVAAQTEALISYGDERSNDSLLQYYGFVIQDNPHETVKVPFGKHPGKRTLPTKLSAYLLQT